MDMTEPLSRSEQSRVNGAKSRGPASAAGKARAARNPVRHGFTSPHQVCLADEDPRAFNAVHEALLNTWCPDCPDGAQLVHRLAVAYHKASRADRMESGLFGRDAAGLLTQEHQLELMLRYGGSAARQIHRCREALLALRRRPHQGLLLVGDLAETIPMDDPVTPEAPPNTPEAPPGEPDAHAIPEPPQALQPSEPEKASDFNGHDILEPETPPRQTEPTPADPAPDQDDVQFAQMIREGQEQQVSRFWRRTQAELAARRDAGPAQGHRRADDWG
jgi:hypothetical protein